MKRNQSKNFMEKKIKKTQKTPKSGTYSSEEKTIILTILVALAIMTAVLVYMAFFTPVQKQPFTSLYLLDSEKQLENLPQTVVLDENSTFTVWIGIENRNDTTIDYSVQVSLENENSAEESDSAELVECFNRTLANGEKDEFEVTINIEEQGTNTVTFELLFFNEAENSWNPTGSSIDLTIEAVEAT